MISINELKKRVEYVESIAQELDWSLNEDSNYIEISKDNLRVCFFMYYDAKYLNAIDREFSSKYNKVFVIVDKDNDAVHNDYFSLISLSTIKTIYAASSEKTEAVDEILRKILIGDYDYVLKGLLNGLNHDATEIVTTNVTDKHACEVKQEESVSDNNSQETQDNIHDGKPRNPTFNLFECAILLDGYLKSTHGDNEATIIQDISDKLRRMATNYGFRIDESYRNYSGIKSQLYVMKQALHGENKYNRDIPAKFLEIVSLYKTNSSKYNSTLDRAEEMCADKTIDLKADNVIDFNNYDREKIEQTKPKYIQIYDQVLNDFSTWQELYIVVVRFLFNRKASVILQKLDTSLISGQRIDFTRDASKLNMPTLVWKGVYVETDINVVDMIERMKILFKSYQMNLSNIKISLASALISKSIAAVSNDQPSQNCCISNADIRTSIMGEYVSEIERNIYFNTYNNLYYLFLESKTYQISNYKSYLYTLNSSQIDFLKGHDSYIIFYFKATEDYAMIPINFICSKLNYVRVTGNDVRKSYHINIDRLHNGKHYLRISNQDRIDIQRFYHKKAEMNQIQDNGCNMIENGNDISNRESNTTSRATETSEDIKNSIVGDNAYELGHRVYFNEKSGKYFLFIESKEYEATYMYWYTLHDYQIKYLKDRDSYVIFYFKETKDYLLIPFNIIVPMLDSDSCNIDKSGGENYQVYIYRNYDNVFHLRMQSKSRILVSKYYRQSDAIDNKNELDNEADVLVEEVKELPRQTTTIRIKSTEPSFREIKIKK